MKQNLKRIVRLLIVLLFCSSLSFVPKLSAQVSINMDCSDHSEKSFTVDGKLLIYDSGGADKASDCSLSSMVKLTPKQKGTPLTITISTLSGNNGYRKAKVLLYSGKKNWDCDYDEDYGDYSCYNPANPELTIEPDKIPISFTSKSADGAITLVLESVKGCEFVAEVQGVIAGPMVYKGIDFPSKPFIQCIGQSRAPIFSFSILTEGTNSPLKISKIRIGGLEQLSSPLMIKVGKAKETPYDPSTGIIPETALQGGRTKITLYGDIPTSVAKGESKTLLLEGFTINGEAKDFIPAKKATLTFSNEIKISQTPTTYIVDKPITLYDDGGKEGNIKENFQGVITFIPQDPSKKLVVEFTKLDLFNTSSTGKNDILKVFNGKEVKAEALLATFLKETGAIYSTAPDGSLTISLQSKAALTKAGFEAQVRAEKPQPMAFQKLEFTPLLPKEGISARTKDEKVAEIDITTLYSEPQLQLKSLSLNISEGILSEVALFDEKGTTELGRVAVGKEEKEVLLTLKSPLALRQNHNRLTLKISIDEKTPSGALLKLSLKGGESTTGDKKDASPQKSIETTILNKAIATLGSQTILLYGPWQYTHQKGGYFSGGYDTKAGNRIVTFKAPNKGEVVAINFHSFSMAFPYSGNNAPKFKIFDGETTSSPLLWEVTKGTKDKGPQDIILSSGQSLTIMVNIDGLNSGKGWEATVSTQKAPRLGIKNITQDVLGATYISLLSEEEIPIAKMTIYATAWSNSRTLEKIEVELEGNRDLVSSYKLYQVVNNKEELLSEVVSSSLNSSKLLFPISSTTPIEVATGKSTFLLKAKVNSGANGDSKLSFNFKKLYLKGEDPFEVSESATPIEKKFLRIVKHHTEGDAKSYTIPSNSAVLYTDDGGLEGKVKEGKFETAVTFLPGAKGEVIFFNIKSGDFAQPFKMSIYEGKEINKEHLLREVYNKNPQKLLWGNRNYQEGAITIVVKKNSKRASYEGWEIEVSSRIPKKREVASSNAKARDAQNILIGSCAVPLFDLEFNIAGEAEGAILPTMQLTAPLATKLYFAYAGAEKRFSTSLPLIPLQKVEGENRFLFQDKTAYSTTGKVYGFIVADMPPKANANENLDFTFEKIGSTSLTEVQTSVTLQKGLEGEYTIGAESGANYAKLEEALNALKRGVSAPVTFLLADGTYEGMFTLSAIPGASAQNRITFKSKSGKAQEVLITHNPKASEAGYAAPKGLFILEKTPYVTLENLSFKITKKVADNAIYVGENSSHFTLKNCLILSQETDPGKGNYRNRFNGVTIASGTEDYSQSDFVTIEGNRFVGGATALEVNPVKNVANHNPKGYIIRNNTLENPYGKAIYVSTGAVEDLLIQGNSVLITKDRVDENGQIWAYDLQLAGAGEKILGNTCYSQKHNRISALYLRKSATRSIYKGTTLIANNSIVISKIDHATITRFAGVKGIEFSDENLKNITLAYNSVRIEVGETPASSDPEENAKKDHFATAILLKPSSSLSLKNNLFYNSRRGNVLEVLGLPNFDIQHNGYYSSSEKPFSYRFKNTKNKLETADCDFKQWQEKASDKASILQKPIFLDDKTALLKEGKEFNVAIPMPELPCDIIGFPRSLEHPTVGAYEFANDYGKELKLNEITLLEILANKASISFKAERSSSLYYLLREATETKPSIEELLKEKPLSCIVATATTISFENLKPATAYKLYGVLKAMSEDKTSQRIELIEFSTKELPTEPASFDNVPNYQEGKPFVDGTMQFSSFSIAKEGKENNGVAKRADKVKGEILLTNTQKGLPLKSMLIRGKGEVTLKTNLEKSRTLQLNDDKEFVLVGLESLGLIKSFTLEGGQNIAIDNVGIAPDDPSFVESKDLIITSGGTATPFVKTKQAAIPYKVSLLHQGKKEEFAEVWTNLIPMQALTPDATAEYTVEVEDNLGRKVTASFFAVVNSKDGKPSFASFEEPLNDEESSDSYYRIQKPFYSGSFKFSNSYIAQYGSWSGFAVSRSTKTDFIDYQQSQWNVPSGKGARNSKSFGLFFKSFGADDAIMMVDPLVAQPLTGMWVSITSYTLSHVEKGDTFLPDGFKEGNFFEVKVTADNGKSVTIPVADYRNGAKKVLKEWTWVSFKELGAVKSLTFTIEGNAKNKYGIVTPAYLAIDNLNDPQGGDAPFIIKADTPTILVAGNTLKVTHAKGVLLSIYDLAGHLVYQVRPTTNNFQETIDLPKGSYIVVCAGTQTKVIL